MALNMNQIGPLLINKSELIDGAPVFKGIPGSVIGLDKKGIYIKTSDSLILLTEFSDNFKPKLGNRCKWWLW